MLFRKTIENVEKYLVKGSLLIFRNSDKSLFLENELISKRVTSFQIIGSLVYFNQDKILHVYDLENKEIQTRNHPFPSREIQNGKFLNISNSELDPKDLNYAYVISTYSYPKGNKLNSSKEKHKIGNGIWRDPYFYFENCNGVIISFHLPTEIPLWQFSVAEVGADKVSKILGVFGKMLVVICEYPHPIMKSKMAEKYLGIHVESGELAWECTTFDYSGNPEPLMGFRSYWQWNEGDSTIKALIGYSLHELNTQNGTLITSHKAKSQISDLRLDFISSTAIQGSHLYFAAMDRNIGTIRGTVGIFDIDTQQVIWHHTLKDMIEGGAIIRTMQPKVSGNKIYVHDTQSTLHILEIEEEDFEKYAKEGPSDLISNQNTNSDHISSEREAENTKELKEHIAELEEQTKEDDYMKVHLDFWTEIQECTNVAQVYHEDSEHFPDLGCYKSLLNDIAALTKFDLDLKEIRTSEENGLWLFEFDLNGQKASIEMKPTHSDWLNEEFIQKVNTIIGQHETAKRLLIIPIDQSFYMLFVDDDTASEIQRLLNKYPEMFQ